jgi:hypothetical protein
MSPFVLMICMLGMCHYVDMPSQQVCQRELSKVDTSVDPRGYAVCLDRRRTEDPNER